jgi:hypothetical protein
LVIDHEDVLTVDQEGGIRLSIAISDSQRQPAEDESAAADEANRFMPNRNTWQISYVYLNLTGTTL